MLLEEMMLREAALKVLRSNIKKGVSAEDLRHKRRCPTDGILRGEDERTKISCVWR